MGISSRLLKTVQHKILVNFQGDSSIVDKWS